MVTDEGIAQMCPVGEWSMAIPTPAFVRDPIPPMMSDIGQRLGWTIEVVGDVWVFFHRLSPSRWSRGVHQAVADELLHAMVPGIGPHLVGRVALEEIRVIDPHADARPWDLDQVDPQRHLRDAWRPGNTSQSANFLAAAAASTPSTVLDAVTLDDGGYDLVPGSSLADTMFDRD